MTGKLHYGFRLAFELWFGDRISFSSGNWRLEGLTRCGWQLHQFDIFACFNQYRHWILKKSLPHLRLTLQDLLFD